MKSAIPFSLLAIPAATPALAHPGNHFHPQDIGFGYVLLGLSVIVLSIILALVVHR